VTGDGEREPALRGLAAALDALALEPSEPSPCPYLPGRDARLVALRPEGFAPVLYRQFLDLNFRRLGDLVYRPQCDGCGECRELRVDAGRFRPTRAQRRCLKRNADVTAGSGRPVPTAEKHAVYQRYLEARHDGHMDGSFEEFSEFLHAGASFTREVVFRLGERLVGAGVYDVTPHALAWHAQRAVVDRGVPAALRAVAVPRLPRRGQPAHGLQGRLPPPRAARRRDVAQGSGTGWR
jgi:hypothetical protein